MATGAHHEAAPTGGVSLGDIQVFPDRPLAELRVGANMAYQAAAVDHKVESYALVCDPASLPRLEAMPALRKIEAGGVLVPQAWRVVDWPPTRRRHIAIAFDRPTGGRVVRTLDETMTPLSEEEAVRHFLGAVVPGLRQMHAAGIVHGSINPTNLYYQDATKRRFILGECVSIATAALQPAICSPIELAMTTPLARGEGQTADDLFGLGVTLAFLLLGRDPSAGLDEDMMLWSRIDFGSYAAIVGNQRLPVGLIELLRGLLADDPKVRWTIPEVEEWLTSRHLVTRQGLAAKRASRPFEFSGRAFFTARALAHAFASDTAAAAAAIRSKEFESWMQRALGDEASVGLMKTARNEPLDAAKSEILDARLVARLSIALDVTAPIRYRDLSAMIDGFGSALASAYLGRGSIQAIAEAIAQGVPQFLFTAKVPPPAEYVQLSKVFEQMRYQLDDNRLGFGAERLLYELHRTVHCLSPLIEQECVVSVNGMLPALERRAADDFGGVFPIDRHCAAFLAARFRAGANEWAGDLSKNDPRHRLVGALRLLSRLQGLSGTTRFPSLARWAAKQATPLIEGYHHRPTRKYLSDQLEAAVKAGNLFEVLAIVDDPARADRDGNGFAEAMRAHAVVAGELRRAADEATRQPQQISELAGQLAAGLATLAASAAALASVVMLG
jgi:hypothetical protein